MSSVDSHLSPHIKRVSIEVLNQSQLEAAAAKDLLAAITNSVPSFISYVNHAHRYEFVNAAYENFFGISRELVVGKHLREVLGNEPYESIKDNLDRALSGEIVRAKIELTSKSGERKFYEGSYTPQFDGDGFVKGIVILQNDVTERVHSQQKLSEREVQLQLALEAAKLGTCDVDLKNDRLIWDAAHHEIFGLEISDSPKTMADFTSRIHPEDREKVTESLMSAAKNHQQRYEQECRIVLPNTGEVRWIVAMGRFVYDESGEAVRIIGVVRDITNLKQQEVRAVAEHRTIQRLLDGVPQLLWRSGVDGKPIYANKQCQKYEGLNVGDTPSALLNAFHPDDADKTLRQWKNAMITGEPFESEYRLRRYDGEYRWFLGRSVPIRNEAGIVCEWIGTATDIHDRKLAEERERLIQRKVAQLQSTATELAKPHTPAEIGKIVVNNVFETLHPDAACVLMLEESRFKVVHARGYHDDVMERVQNKPASIQLMYEAIRDQRPLIIRASDQIAERYPSFKQFFDEYKREAVIVFPLIVEGRAVGILCMGFNSPTTFSQERISYLTILAEQCAQTLERARLFEAEQQARKSAEIASQAKTQFLANMSHEIRTPMNAILGFSDLLGDQTISDHEREEYRRRIRANGSQLLHLIDDVLNLSRVEAGKLELSKAQISVVEFITDVHASATLVVRDKGVKTPLSFDGNVPEMIESDPIRLRQIIMNLLSNASKFTDSGTIRTRVSFLKKPNPTESRLIIDVEDTGIGISEELQSKLFQPFSQADSSITRKFGGAGLGLVLSRRLATALGGTLDLVRSQPMKGSQFRLSLPLTMPTGTAVSIYENDQEGADRVAKELNYDNSLQGVRILLAEDSPDNEALIRAYLRPSGAEVEIARDGDQAIVKAQSGNFDLVLMDIQMPKTDGLQATRRLRELKFNKPILALSAHALPEEIQRSLEAGCQGHLTKPVSRQGLLEKIHQTLKH